MQKKLELITSQHRDWQSFSNEKLSEKLSFVDWNINFDDVQEYWNTLENKIIVIVDEIVPLKTYIGHVIKESTPKLIKNKINKRNRLLKSFKMSPKC